jgi:hypothetical protein
MNALLVFCAYMTTVYLPFDLFWKPVAEDQEVWFGFMLSGWAVVQVAIGMFVWNLLDERSPGWWVGAISCLPFAALAVALWWQRSLFTSVRGSVAG